MVSIIDEWASERFMTVFSDFTSLSHCKLVSVDSKEKPISTWMQSRKDSKVWEKVWKHEVREGFMWICINIKNVMFFRKTYPLFSYFSQKMCDSVSCKWQLRLGKRMYSHKWLWRFYRYNFFSTWLRIFNLFKFRNRKNFDCSCEISFRILNFICWEKGFICRFEFLKTNALNFFFYFCFISWSYHWSW